MAKLKFRFRPEKFVNAVAYLATACPQSTKLSVCKLVYLADKEHLVNFGRPIIGDEYYHLEHGPVPSRGLNMLRNRGNRAEAALLDRYVVVIGKSVYPKQAADRSVFSKSDLAVLDSVIASYGNLSPSKLRAITHGQAPCKKSERNRPIDYELFFADAPQAGALKDLAEGEQQGRDTLDAYAAD